MIKLILTLSFLAPTALAFQQTARAMSVEPFGSASGTIGATVASSVTTTLAAAATVGTTYYLWTELQTRRAYNHAADAARAALSEKNTRPISTAPAGDVLRLVADIERDLLRGEGVDPATVTEVSLARRIILHADQFTLLK